MAKIGYPHHDQGLPIPTPHLSHALLLVSLNRSFGVGMESMRKGCPGSIFKKDSVPHSPDYKSSMLTLSSVIVLIPSLQLKLLYVP